MGSRSASTRTAVALLFLGGPLSAQVTQLGTPYLSGCAPGPGLAGIGISTLGEPRIGNSGFGVLTQNIYAQDMTLVVGSCAPSPSAPSQYMSSPCPSLPGGCLVYVDLAGPVLFVQPFGVLWTFQAPSTTGRVWSLPVPNSTALVGQTFCMQLLAGPPTISGFGNCESISNGLSITILP